MSALGWCCVPVSCSSYPQHHSATLRHPRRGCLHITPQISQISQKVLGNLGNLRGTPKVMRRQSLERLLRRVRKTGKASQGNVCLACDACLAEHHTLLRTQVAGASNRVFQFTNRVTGPRPSYGRPTAKKLQRRRDEPSNSNQLLPGTLLQCSLELCVTM